MGQGERWVGGVGHPEVTVQLEVLSIYGRVSVDLWDVHAGLQYEHRSYGRFATLLVISYLGYYVQVYGRIPI